MAVFAVPRRFHLEKSLLRSFLLLLLFSNLLSRLSGANINVLLYLLFFFVVLSALSHAPCRTLTIATTALGLYLLLHLFDPRAAFVVNALAAKDFAVPVFGVLVGFRIFLYRRDLIPHLNLLYLPFVTYGLVQEIAFYAGRFAEVLPWDAAWVDTLQSGGVRNLYQGELLRFFGTMNAFYEYQIYIAILPAFLWLNVRNVKRRGLLLFNSILALFVLTLAVERSPVLLLTVLIMVWGAWYLVHSARRALALGFATTVLLMLLSTVGTAGLTDHPVVGEPVERLMNVITLNFAGDEAIAERVEVQWRTAFELARQHPLGIGPGRVAPATESYEGSIQPHNNYLAYQLAYGVLGLLFAGALGYAVMQAVGNAARSSRFFGYGLIVSYAAAAVFSLPFVGKAGTLFFLIMGFVSREGQIGGDARTG